MRRGNFIAWRHLSAALCLLMTVVLSPMAAVGGYFSPAGGRVADLKPDLVIAAPRHQKIMALDALFTGVQLGLSS